MTKYKEGGDAYVAICCF